MKKWPHPPSPGVLHFVTVVTQKRLPLFRSSQLCREFFLTLAEVKIRFPFELFAYVLLPDHLHLLLRPPDGDISALMQKIKSLTAKRFVETLRKQGNKTALARLRKHRPGRRAHAYQVFQDSFRDLQLWSPWMIKQKIDYIHRNPIDEQLVENVASYPWSSWRAVYERSREPISIDPLPP
jgi:REP element-mobilizing transposase RayT